ncbi:MAG TPA: hypothetical protein VGJ38_17070 [Jatrophihabitantaceae bacterium]
MVGPPRDPDKPREPESWRDWIRADYEYPEDFGTLSRAQRRRAKRSWRREDQAQRMAWLREHRQAEPAGPGGVLVAIVFLAIVILGFGGALPRLLHHGKADRPPVGLLTPAASAPVDPPSAPATSAAPSWTSPPSVTPTSPSPKALPTATQRATAGDVAAASRVAGLWARSFYTRNPAKETYEQLVTKAARYMTPEVKASFIAAGDSTYQALKNAHGTSRVLAVPVSAPRPGTAPVDTPRRITRLVTVNVQITGTKPVQITVPLRVTLIRQDTTWLVSDVDGGAGT